MGRIGAVPEVLLAGFEADEAEELCRLLEGRCEVQTVPDLGGAQRALDSREVAVLCLGPLLSPAESREVASRAADKAGGAALVLLTAAGPDPARFQDLIDEDRLFYLSLGALPVAELAELIRSALARREASVMPEMPADPSAQGPARSRMRRALQAARRVSAQPDLMNASELLRLAVEEAVEADRAYCLLYDPMNETLWSRSTGLAAEERRESAAVGLVSFVARTARPVRVERLAADPRYEREADDPCGQRGERFLAVPVRAPEGRVLAVLSAVRDAGGAPFSDADREELELLAATVAPPLAQLELEARLDEEARQADRTLREQTSDLFRAEAVEHYVAAGSREGDWLRISPRLPRRLPALRKPSFRKRIPYVPQTATSDCGAACLAMVLAHFGKPLPLEEVRKITGVGRGGTDAMGILQAGQWFGLRGRGVRVEAIEDLAALDAGTILHWRFNHFVVLERSRRDGLEVVDPAGGRRVVSLQEARRSFTGVALTFEPGEGFAPEPAVARRRPWRYLQPLRERPGALARVAAASVLIQVFALAVPLLIGVLVDRVVPQHDVHLLTVLAAGLLGMVVFNLLAVFIRSFLLLELRSRLDARLTLDFVDHLVSLPFRFFQERSAGDLIMRMNSNETVREILTAGALSTLLDGLLVSLCLIVIFVVSFPMGLLVLGLALLRVVLLLATRWKQKELMARSLHTQAASQTYQVQMLAGMETLKASGSENRALEHWSNLFVDTLNVSLARGRLTAVVDTLLAALAMASPMAVLLYGAWQVFAGKLSLGEMLALNALAAAFLTPLTQLVTTAFQFQILGSYLDRIEDVMQTPREQEPCSGRPAGRLRGGVRLEGVSFRYGPTAPLVVRDVSVDIAPGSFVAVVGRSGAGKSTLANLLVGLYQPAEGQILFDGVNLSELNLQSVRRQMGVVPQHPYLFGLSIRANIALAHPTLPLRAVVDAARLAHIHEEIIAMPLAYDTILADGGASLSGGQRQRLALARALVQQPAILLLDEATSALDALTESAIQRDLAQLRCTRIVVAHRLSTIQSADLILVMDEGRIVERGTHEALMARGGAYAELVARQVKRAEVEAG